MLRDELTGRLQEMQLDEDMVDMVDEADRALYASFNQWLEDRESRAYGKVCVPVMEKMVKALRVALGLKPDIPDLSNIPCGRGDRERERGTREEYRQYLELKKKGLKDAAVGHRFYDACRKCAQTVLASFADEKWHYAGQVFSTFDKLCDRLLAEFQE